MIRSQEICWNSREATDLMGERGGTALNVAVDKGGESGPPELGGDQLPCFQEAGMPGGVMIMAAFEDSAAKRVVCGNVDTAFIGENAGFDLPVG